MGIIQSSFNQVASEAVKVGGVIKPILEQSKLTPELLNKYADKILAEQRNIKANPQVLNKLNEISKQLDESKGKGFEFVDNTDKIPNEKDVIDVKPSKADFIKQKEAIDNLNQLSLAKERQKIMKSIMRDSYKGGIK